MQATSSAQRLTLQAACPNGYLLAGATQWLGIAIKPLHDSLGAMRLQLFAKMGGALGRAGSFAALGSLGKLT